MANRAPNIQALSHANIRLDCDPGLVRALWKAPNPAALRALWPATPERVEGLRRVKREMINDAAGFHGIEYLGRHRRTEQAVYYCNAGDTYAPTLIFMGNSMTVGTWGDLIESGRVIPRD